MTPDFPGPAPTFRRLEAGAPPLVAGEDAGRSQGPAPTFRRLEAGAPPAGCRRGRRAVPGAGPYISPAGSRRHPAGCRASQAPTFRRLEAGTTPAGCRRGRRAPAGSPPLVDPRGRSSTGSRRHARWLPARTPGGPRGLPLHFAGWKPAPRLVGGRRAIPAPWNAPPRWLPARTPGGPRGRPLHSAGWKPAARWLPARTPGSTPRWLPARTPGGFLSPRQPSALIAPPRKPHHLKQKRRQNGGVNYLNRIEQSMVSGWRS